MQAELERLATGVTPEARPRRPRDRGAADPGRDRRPTSADLRRDLAREHQRLHRPAEPASDPGRPGPDHPPPPPPVRDRSRRCSWSRRAATGLGSSPSPVGRAERDRLWFLSMCFIRPAEQARGLGRPLLEAILPPAGDDAVLATPPTAPSRSRTRLYSRYGIVPRMPLLSVSGYVTRPTSLPELPQGMVACPSRRSPPGAGRRRPPRADDRGRRRSIGSCLASTHPQDHRFLRTEGRHGFLYRDAIGATRSATATPGRRAGSVRSPSGIGR